MREIQRPNYFLLFRNYLSFVADLRGSLFKFFINISVLHYINSNGLDQLFVRLFRLKTLRTKMHCKRSIKINLRA